MMAPMFVEPHHEVEYIARIKRAVTKTPILGCIGRLIDPATAEKYVVEQMMDMVGGARGFIADPALAQKGGEGKSEEINPCNGCNDYCVSNLFGGLPITCIVNPAAGREKEWGRESLRPVGQPKNVWVIGGGPSGLEAARVAATRGHRVTVWEREASLGGHLRQLGQLPGRNAFLANVAWWERQLEQLGVRVIVGREFTAADVDKSCDAVLVATGSRYRKDGLTGFIAQPIPGWDQEHVFTPEEAFLRLERFAGRTVLLDEEGYMMGPGLAQLLAERGAEVHYVTRWPLVAPSLQANLQFAFVYPALYAKGVSLTVNHFVQKIEGSRVTIFNIYTNEERVIEDVSAVILITGRQSDAGVAEAVSGRSIPVRVIGDARAPRGLGEVVMDGFEAAVNL